MKLQYQRTVHLGGDAEGVIFSFERGGREVVFIRDGNVTTARVEPLTHWLLRKLRVDKTEVGK